MSKPWEKYAQDPSGNPGLPGPWQKYSPESKEKVDFSAGTMVKNIPSSAANLAGDIYHAVTNPVDTAKSIGTLGKGLIDRGVNKAMEFGSNQRIEALQRISDGTANEQDYVTAQINPSTPPDQINEALSSAFDEESIRQQESGEKMESVAGEQATVDQVGEFIKGRYGSVDNFKKTVMEDPVGALADAAAVLSGVGAGVKSSTLSKAAALTDPVNLAMKGTKVAVGKMIPKKTPRNLFESAAKFSTTLDDTQRGRMVNTALREGLMPTRKGVGKLGGIVDAIDASLDSLIKTATAEGKSIPKAAVFRHLKELRRHKGGPVLDAQKDLRAINKIAREFDLHLKKLGKTHLTPEELQKLKRDTYKKINWNAKRMKGTPIKEDTQKAIARGAKDSIEDLVPEIGPQNARIGDLLDLQPHLQRAANRIENRNFVSINTPLNLGAGGVAGGEVGVAAGALASMLEAPKIKARTALTLNNLRNQANLQELMKTNPAAARARLAAIMAGRLDESLTEANQQ